MASSKLARALSAKSVSKMFSQFPGTHGATAGPTIVSGPDCHCTPWAPFWQLPKQVPQYLIVEFNIKYRREIQFLLAPFFRQRVSQQQQPVFWR